MDIHSLHTISDASHPGELRRAAVALAGQLGFSASDAGRVGLVATEAASNIVKHARQGAVLMRAMPEVADRAGIELLALDRGPGMADLARSMEDGHSTASSPGTGLGALSRLATLLDIYSAPTRGTALLARILPQGAQPKPATLPFVVGGVRVPKPGELACGDDWSVGACERGARFLVVDGLGHGASAAQAARAAVDQFDTTSGLPLPDVVQALHGALLPTRGAAASIAEIAPDASEALFVGVGNVVGLLAWPGGGRHMVGQNGTLGAALGTLRVAPYPWTGQTVLVMHSDGLKSQTSLDPYPGLLAHHPALIAGVLYRDFARGTDDATVLVARQEGLS